MKQIYVIAILFFFLGGIAHADEMIVHLKSGNSVIIQYSGNIEGVKLEGDSDAIVGINMQKAAKPEAYSRNDNSEKETSSIHPVEKSKNTKKSNQKAGIRWADPISED